MEETGYALDTASIYSAAVAADAPAEPTSTASDDAKGEAPAESTTVDEVNLNAEPKEVAKETAPVPTDGKDATTPEAEQQAAETPEVISKLIEAHRFSPEEKKLIKSLYYGKQEYQRIMPLGEAREIRNIAPTLEDVRYGAAAAEKVSQFTHDFTRDTPAFAENLKATDEKAYDALVRHIAPEVEKLDPDSKVRLGREGFENTVLGLSDATEGEVYHILVSRHGVQKAAELTPGLQEAARFIRDALVDGKVPERPGFKDPRAQELDRREQEIAAQRTEQQRYQSNQFVSQVGQDILAATDAAIRAHLGDDFSPDLTNEIVQKIGALATKEFDSIPANERAFKQMLAAAMDGDQRYTPKWIAGEILRRMTPHINTHAAERKTFYAKQLVGANQEKRQKSDAIGSRKDIGSGAAGGGKPATPDYSKARSAKDVFSAALNL